MAVKRIKVSMINLIGPVLIFVIALLALDLGHNYLAAAGIVGAVTWVIGACTVRVIWRTEKNPERMGTAAGSREQSA